MATDANKQWLKAVIESRDRINHYKDGGLPIRNFAVFCRPDGTIEMPMRSDDMKLSDAITMVWENFFRYVQAFMVLAAHCRVPERYAILRSAPQPPDSPQSCWTIIDRAYAVELLRWDGVVLPADLEKP